MSDQPTILVYVAGPYTSDPVNNVRQAVRWGNALTGDGIAAHVPHLTMLADLIDPRPYAHWLAIDLAILTRCDVVVRLPGMSDGADVECAAATELGIPILYPRIGYVGTVDQRAHDLRRRIDLGRPNLPRKVSRP